MNTLIGDYDYDIFDGLGDFEIHPEDAENFNIYAQVALEAMQEWMKMLMGVLA